jgi:hypothetical protein
MDLHLIKTENFTKVTSACKRINKNLVFDLTSISTIPNNNLAENMRNEITRIKNKNELSPNR